MTARLNTAFQAKFSSAQPHVYLFINHFHPFLWRMVVALLYSLVYTLLGSPLAWRFNLPYSSIPRKSFFVTSSNLFRAFSSIFSLFVINLAKEDSQIRVETQLCTFFLSDLGLLSQQFLSLFSASLFLLTRFHKTHKRTYVSSSSKYKCFKY